MRPNRKRSAIYSQLQPSSSGFETVQQYASNNMFQDADDAVLFSRRSGEWKISDFGITTEMTGDGSSRRLIVTPDQRGTRGYAAPEILEEENGKFNKRSDIWGFGCVIYELLGKRKLFKSDFATVDYANGRKPLELPTVSTCFPRLTLSARTMSAIAVMGSMLAISPDSRPKADEMYNFFSKELCWYKGDLNEYMKEMNNITKQEECDEVKSE